MAATKMSKEIILFSGLHMRITAELIEDENVNITMVVAGRVDADIVLQIDWLRKILAAAEEDSNE